MKLVKSLLLATAGGLVAVSGASAADLGGITKPAPAEYVRVCNAYGAGFFYIPGTQTCLRVSGRARFEGHYAERYNRDDTATGFRAIARIALDARTQSEYGPVRAFVRLDTAYRTGSLVSGSASRFYSANTTTPTGNGITTQLYPEIESAFVQFAGFTAGKLASFFDFNAGSADSFIAIGGSGTFTPIQLAYTATFGSGFSATLAIEDPSSRRNTTAFSIDGIPAIGGATGATRSIWGYSGGNVPDVVAALRVDQGWGSAQLSGLLHQVNYAAYNTIFGAPHVAGVGPGPGTDYGFAVQAGLKVNLPMLAPGDYLQLTGTYSKGAVNTVVGLDCGYGSINQCSIGNANSFTKYLAFADSAVAVDSVTGAVSTKLTTAYGITGSFRHYWAPTLRQAVYASYAKIDYAGGTGFADSTLWRVGTNVVWSPIKDLEIGPEVLYTNLRGGRGYATNGVYKGQPFVGNLSKGSEDQWQFRFRVQRDF